MRYVNRSARQPQNTPTKRRMLAEALALLESASEEEIFQITKFAQLFMKPDKEAKSK